MLAYLAANEVGAFTNSLGGYEYQATTRCCQENGLLQRRRGRKRRRISATTLENSHRAEVGNRPLKLQFDVFNLIQSNVDPKHQALKMQSLASIAQAAYRSIADDKDSRSGSHQTSSEAEIDLPDHLAPFRRFLCTSNHSLGDHRGNFRLFIDIDGKSTDSTTLLSLPSNALFSMDNPFTFLRDSLSYQSNATRHKRGGMMYDASEVLVWCCSDSSYGQLEYISSVMDDMPFAQLCLGTSGQAGRWQENTEITLDSETIKTLQSMGILLMDGEDCNIKSNYVICKLRYEDLYVIEAVLCYSDGNGDNNNKFVQTEQQTLIHLVDAAVESIRTDPLNKGNEPRLVLLADSISASRISAAISSWKKQQIQHQKQSKRRLEDLLNQALTIVTFGNLCQSFSSGPAYIHIFMLDDPFTTELGATTTPGGGRKAVYFNALSPYVYDQDIWSKGHPTSLKTHNAHNLNACTIQFLALIMRINGIQSFRALYDAARFVDPRAILDINPKHFAVNYGNIEHGNLVIPPRLDDELLPAMIRAAGGDRWLWKDGSAAFDSLLPDEIEATSHLEESFGYSAFEEICDTCSCEI